LTSFFFTLAAAGFFQTTQAYLAYHIHKFRLYFTGLATYYFNSLQIIGALAFAVHGLYFLHPLQCKRILLGAVGHGIPHQVFENILLHQKGSATGYFQHIGIVGEMLQRIEVGIEFVIEAALQPSALAAQFGLVDAQVLIACSSSVYAFKISEPGAAA
jgi:hypothetical protein